ncbi:hypothetical protein [Sorangium sp. So ce406]|uniref:hypothetical protein n=1 Tax=Sorangium sp. So ce406 TaxID=3133311 RepID=UPI003F5CB209
MSSRTSRPPPRAVIVGAGARAANGLTALQVTMGVRAGKLEPRESHLIDRAGEPISTARLASIGDNVTGLDRLVALGASALRQAAAPWLAARASGRPASGEPEPLPILVAVPSEQRPGLDPRLGRDLLAGLSARAQVRCDPARSRLFFGCRAGGVEAVMAALDLLGEGAPAVLVGGVDSWFEPEALERLDRELRLHSLTAENGFIPGEGAGFVLLAASPRARGAPQLGSILSAATDVEPRPWGSDEPCLAAGITRAARRAVEEAGASSRPIGWLMTDVVDERHRVDEWAFAAARIADALTPDHVHEQPLLVTGDLGAASVGVMLAIAVTRWETGCAPDAQVLIAAHAEGAARGALVAAAAR